MLMLDAYATGFWQLYSRLNKYKSSGTQCVVTLFKAKVISRVNVEYQFARFQNTICNFLKSVIHTMYCVKLKMTKLFLTYSILLCNIYYIFKDYSIYI